MHVSPSMYLRVNPPIKYMQAPPSPVLTSPPPSTPLRPNDATKDSRHLLFNCISNKQLANLPYLLLVALLDNPLPLSAGLLAPLVMPCNISPPVVPRVSRDSAT